MAGSMFRELRLAEIRDTIELLRRYRPSGALLEIGAGTGWQAKALANAGYEVEAIDLPASSELSNHSRARDWPIVDYDGSHIPFSDDRFDIIYSSNVLEHVVDLDTLTAEMKRVLRPGGLALHLVPNGNWRVLSLITYYPGQAIDAFRWLRRRKPGSVQSTQSTKGHRSRLVSKAARRLLPHAHGSSGTALSEIRRFSKAQWDDYFARTGWDVIAYGNNGLLASGDYLLGTILPIQSRKALGRVIGGIAHLYVVEPKQ